LLFQVSSIGKQVQFKKNKCLLLEVHYL
jgi:hypothetical protein